VNPTLTLSIPHHCPPLLALLASCIVSRAPSKSHRLQPMQCRQGRTHRGSRWALAHPKPGPPETPPGHPSWPTFRLLSAIDSAFCLWRAVLGGGWRLLLFALCGPLSYGSTSRFFPPASRQGKLPPNLPFLFPAMRPAPCCKVYRLNY
jgi:hypothetical protein